MRSTSAIVNKALRHHVAAVLRQAGFEKVDARNGWHWLDKSIWVVNIRAVGNYFSEVTGWPPGSVEVWLGVFYRFMPTDHPIKLDDKGRLLPAEYLCQMRSHLECTLHQSERLERLPNTAERRRRDIWWIDPDGSNACLVAADIGETLGRQGVRWFETQSNLSAALAVVEGSHDSFVKFDTAALLARELGDRERLLKYSERAELEGSRIGRRIDSKARYGV